MPKKLDYVGPGALVSSLSIPRQRKRNGPKWQYHPRSDHHSKVACLLIAIDVLRACKLLQNHVLDGKVAFGINHSMTDYSLQRSKKLDLVIHTAPLTDEEEDPEGGKTLDAIISSYGLVLDPTHRRMVDSLPSIIVRPVQEASVLMAFEAKACMTEFAKARPRLYDELNSAHHTIHGDTDAAIAVGFLMVNSSSTFISPLKNARGYRGRAPIVTSHVQPDCFDSVIEKVRQLPLRGSSTKRGFDVIGIVDINCANDGSPITLTKPSRVPDQYAYWKMIDRISTLYGNEFKHL